MENNQGTELHMKYMIEARSKLSWWNLDLKNEKRPKRQNAEKCEISSL
jgi:hypothetical protein